MIHPYTIVIPAYNEEKRIGKVLAEIAADSGSSSSYVTAPMTQKRSCGSTQVHGGT